MHILKDFIELSFYMARPISELFIERYIPIIYLLCNIHIVYEIYNNFILIGNYDGTEKILKIPHVDYFKLEIFTSDSRYFL